MNSSTPAQQTTLRQLQGLLERMEDTGRGGRAVGSGGGLPIEGPLARLLPPEGLPRGAVVEWLAEGPASGATWLALYVARAALDGDRHPPHHRFQDAVPAGRHRRAGPNQGPALVVIDPQHRFYAPAAAALGIDPARLIIVRPAEEGDERWALDQALRCPGVAAVLWRGDQLDAGHFRRCQLACQASGVIGLLVRPLTARREPSWADVRLLVRALPACNRQGASSDGVAEQNTSDPSDLPLSSWRRVQVQRIR
ncbi:MAG: hypothetical protein GTO03_05640, partial [Planctomycetales bacterium]|nr:hypothetical protein [Planctomycetales bacterium]